MKNRLLLLGCLVMLTFSSIAQEKPSFDFYGFVRGDLYYNSRKNMEATDGIFFLYPLAPQQDELGKDMNKRGNGSFATLNSRVGLDIKGFRIGKALARAKIEADFAGTGDLNFLLRLRQAYIHFDWENGSTLLLGQTWHPFFESTSPTVLSLACGAPFQAFNRSPMVRYQYQTGSVILKVAALYQLMDRSFGPDGVSNKYVKNGMLPELVAGVEYRSPDFKVGAGYSFLSIQPRQESVVDNKIYKVSERLSSSSFEVYAAYKTSLWDINGKTALVSNMAHATMLGGYGVKSVDSLTGKRKYTPSRHSSSWLNIIYGKEWQVGMFAGYLKNLGTSDALLSTTEMYGRGMDIDQMLSGSLQVNYNKSHWSLGFEYNLNRTYYGDISLADGKVENSSGVNNHRIVGVFVYKF